MGGFPSFEPCLQTAYHFTQLECDPNQGFTLTIYSTSTRKDSGGLTTSPRRPRHDSNLHLHLDYPCSCIQSCEGCFGVVWVTISHLTDTDTGISLLTSTKWSKGDDDISAHQCIDTNQSEIQRNGNVRHLLMLLLIWTSTI